MAYEVFELKRPYKCPSGSYASLLAMLRASKDTLSEAVGIPITADLLDLVPELIDPYLDGSSGDAEAEAVRIQTEIQKAIAKHGVWLSRDGRKAVTLASYDED